MRSRDGAICIICPFEFVDSIPCVRNFAIMMARSSIPVELFVIESGAMYSQLNLDEVGLTLHKLPEKMAMNSVVKKVPYLSIFAAWVGKRCLGKNILSFIGVDPSGLVCAAILGTVFRKPWVYFSLEIPVLSDPECMYRSYKPYELWASRRSDLIIIQDESRARVMADENQIPMDKFAYLPNSPLGPAKIEKSNILRERLGLNSDHTIILNSGSHGRSMCSLEIAQSAQEFPDGWKLVFHMRWNHPSLKTYFGNFLDSGKVILSCEPVPYEQLRGLVGSADIGIALYNQPKSPNTLFLGKSSGKLNQYLHCGVPVITSKLPGWTEWLSRYHSGVFIESPHHITGAVQTIIDDYENFSKGAVDQFEMELRFEPAFSNLLNYMKKLDLAP